MTDHPNTEHDDRRRTLTEADIEAIITVFREKACFREVCQFDETEIRALKDFVELFAGIKSNVLKTLYLFLVLVVIAITALAFKHGLWTSK